MTTVLGAELLKAAKTTAGVVDLWQATWQGKEIRKLQKELWLPVSAVTKWQRKVREKTLVAVELALRKREIIVGDNSRVWEGIKNEVLGV